MLNTRMKKKQHPLRRKIFAIVMFTVAFVTFGATLIVMNTLGKGIETFDLTFHFSAVQLVKLYLETSVPGSWYERGGVLYKGTDGSFIDGDLYYALKEYLPSDTMILYGAGSPPEPRKNGWEIASEKNRRRPSLAPPPNVVPLDRPVATANGAYTVVRGDGGEVVGWIAVSSDGNFLRRSEFRMRIYLLTIAMGIFFTVAAVLGFLVLRITRPIEQIAAAHKVASDRNIVLAQESRTDPLTGLLNRRGFFATLAEERTVRPSHVAILDIDHFKDVNDRRGHDVGDRVLSDMASLLASRVRAGDLCCRWGGEEFVIAFVGIRDDDALASAERIREAIEGMVIRVEDRREDGTTFGITVTIGVSALGLDGLHGAIASADRALYEGKREGRNRVVAAVRP